MLWKVPVFVISTKPPRFLIAAAHGEISAAIQSPLIMTNEPFHNTTDTRCACRSEARTVFSKQRTPAVLLSEVSKNIMQCFCGDRANGFSLPLARRTRAKSPLGLPEASLPPFGKGGKSPSGDRVRSASDATLRRVPLGKPQNRHVFTLMAVRRCRVLGARV